MINSFNLFVWKFFRSSILNAIFLVRVSLFVGCFPFTTLNISFHSFVICKVSDEKSANSFMEFPLNINAVSLLHFKILSLIFDILMIMCLGMKFLWFIYLWLPVIPEPKCLFPSPGEGNFQQLFLQIGFMSFSLTLLCMGLCYANLLFWLMSQRSLSIFLLLKILFFFPLFTLVSSHCLFLDHQSVLTCPLTCSWFSLVYIFISITVFFNSYLFFLILSISVEVLTGSIHSFLNSNENLYVHYFKLFIW